MVAWKKGLSRYVGKAWCPFCMEWLPLGDVRYLKARSGRRLSTCPRCGRHNLRFKPRFHAHVVSAAPS